MLFDQIEKNKRMSDYYTSIEFNSSSEKVFEAISKNLTSWWGQQDHLINKEGTVFTVSWGEPWYRFKVISYTENQEMIWECVDANQIIQGLDGVQKEWVGTKVHWRITELEDKTVLNFKHEGLIPEFICFNVCSSSWDSFLKVSLVQFLEGSN